jgi:aspartate carbamoyltransferase catalytic subunit
MTDLFTIGKLKSKRITGLEIGICGDLLYGRTVHSLLKALSLYSGNTFYFISTPELQAPEYFTIGLGKNNKIIKADKIEECINKHDIIYITRIQRERFSCEKEYEKQTGIYILDKKKLNMAKKDLTILHPLPKNDEIASEIDDDPRAQYFNQAQLGLYIRMALLIKILENPKPPPEIKISSNTDKKCGNKICVTNTEKNLPDIIKTNYNKICCAYCEKEN